MIGRFSETNGAMGAMRAMGSTNIDPLKLFKLEEGSFEELGRCMLSVHLHIAIFCRIFDAMRTSLEMGLLHEHPEVRLQGENASNIIKPAGVCSFVLRVCLHFVQQTLF